MVEEGSEHIHVWIPNRNSAISLLDSCETQMGIVQDEATYLSQTRILLITAPPSKGTMKAVTGAQVEARKAVHCPEPLKMGELHNTYYLGRRITFSHLVPFFGDVH